MLWRLRLEHGETKRSKSERIHEYQSSLDAWSWTLNRLTVYTDLGPLSEDLIVLFQAYFLTVALDLFERSSGERINVIQPLDRLVSSGGGSAIEI